LQELVIVTVREPNDDEDIASLETDMATLYAFFDAAVGGAKISDLTWLVKNTPRHLSPRHPGVLSKFFTQRVARREYTVQKTHYSGAVDLFRDVAPSRGVGQQQRTAVLRLCQNRELTR
jgi:hypothetical protein